MEYTTRELTPEEGKALTDDITALLEKHNAEIGVISSIQLLKRVPTDTPSPYGNTEETTEEKPDTETEEGGTGSSEESA